MVSSIPDWHGFPLTMHETIISRLARAYERDRLGHCLLLTGGGGNGAYHVAVRLAQMFLCPSWDEPNGCQTCQSIGKLNHPDLSVLSPLPPRFGEGNASSTPDPEPVSATLSEDLFAPLNVGANWKITSEQADRLITWAWQTPWQAPRKVAIVAEADFITELIAPKLLKTLEEPPPAVTFLLITSRPQNLLPTVRSRCQVVPIPPLTEDEIVRILVEHGADEGDARSAAMLANGDVWVAQSLTRAGAEGTRRNAYNLIETALDPKKKPVHILDLCRKLLAPPEGKTRWLPSEEAAIVGEITRWMAWGLRNILVNLEESSEVPEELRSILPSAKRIGFARLFSWLDEVDRIHEMSIRNVSAMPALFALAMYLRDDRRVFRETDGSEIAAFPSLTWWPSL
ncbi:MAG TPA: hypothetical protein PLJ50_08275 [Candidatus Latescibacteria bacterium]|nr:hypothetical protein [Candidatus Latescibacterota bacterium]